MIIIPTPGQNGTSTITISPSGVFTGNVSLICAVTGGPNGAADVPTCSVTAPPAITAAAAVTATLTVSTTAASGVPYRQVETLTQNPQRIVPIGGSIAVIASLLLFGFPAWRRRTMLQLGLLLVATLIGAAIGCNGKNAVPSPANPGTTPGAYTVTVTGSSGAITAVTAVTVTVN